MLHLELKTSQIKKNDFFLWADIVELSCLQDEDFQIPVEDALDERLGSDESIGGIIDSEPRVLLDDDGTGRLSAERNDNYARQIDEICIYLEARSKLFGELYPFEYNDGFIERKHHFSLAHKLYVFMLFSSHLPSILQCERYTFTNDFEIISGYAIKNLVPAWKCKMFGTAHCEKLLHYVGTPADKIKNFSRDTGLPLGISEEELHRFKTPSGDAKVDVVAWYPFNDNAAHMPVILAQAGCTENEATILDKQLRIKPWEYRLPGLMALPCTVSPLCYRTPSNKWPGESSVVSIFLDRLRVIKLTYQDTEFDISDLQSITKIRKYFPVEQP